MHVCTYACGRWRLTSGVCFDCSLVYLLNHLFTDHEAHQSGQTQSPPRELPVSISPALELQVCAAVFGICVCVGVWGFYGMELRYVCLCDKYFINWTIFPAHRKLFFYCTRPLLSGGNLTHNTWCGFGCGLPPPQGPCTGSRYLWR